MELYNTTDKKKYEVNIPFGSGEYYLTCPACSHNRKPINQRKKCLSFNRSSNIGHCHHCGANYKGLRFNEEGLNSSTLQPSTLRSNPQPLTTNYLPLTIIKRSWGLESNFGYFLKSIFDTETIAEIMENYFLGMTKDRSVIYWYIDKNYRLRSGKIMQYDATTGKRVQSEKINWVHSILKQQGKLDKDWTFQRSLFGEHLLTKYPQKDVLLFEGEKTAVICSAFFPDNICLATGGSEMLSKSVCEALRGRKVLAIADSDKELDWAEKIKEINREMNLNLKPYSKLNNLLTQEQREMKWDLADYLISIEKNP